MYHERQVSSFAGRFMYDVWPSSLDDAVAAPWEPVDDERPEFSPGGIVVSVPTVTGHEKGDWNFRDMLLGSYSGREQGRVVIFNIQRLVSHAGLPSRTMVGMYCTKWSVPCVTFLR